MNPHGPDRGAQGVEEAYAEYGDALFRFALRLCGHRDDAEDLVVETFVEAHRRWGTFRGIGSRRAWLYGIAANRARMARRRARPTEPLSDGIPQSGPDATDRLVLEEAIARLPPKRRAAFLLVKAEGLTAREAAEALGRPLGTVLYEVHRAVHELRTALGEEPLPTLLAEAKP